MKEKLKNSIFEAKLELARREFYFYCQLKAPDFYTEDKEYLKYTCDLFQAFYEGSDEVLVINMPPRHGKSRTAQLFVEWLLGKNRNEKIMTGSYNETLSTVFAKGVRNNIQEIKADPDKIVYGDIFPDTKIKKGDGSMHLWSLEGSHNNYLATSPTGTATGFGCSIMIIDDLIKNAMEARNANVLKNHWDWFTNTMISRMEEGAKTIIIMTRWATDDLAGKALRHYQEEGKKVKNICLKALQDDGSMLCDSVLSKKSYESKKRALGNDIAEANYQQAPIDVVGRLYSGFKTYKETPHDKETKKPLFTRIFAYVDTADTGNDFLCMVICGEYNKEAYVLDVYYTKAPMEKTETETAKRLHNNNVGNADIESNNGGRGFARNVERILKDKFNSNRTRIKWFHQSQNKMARILSNATWVMDHIYYPANWKDRWPEYYKAMNRYQREGKNEHDDAPDATTGVAEKMNKKKWLV